MTARDVQLHLVLEAIKQDDNLAWVDEKVCMAALYMAARDHVLPAMTPTGDLEALRQWAEESGYYDRAVSELQRLTEHHEAVMADLQREMAEMEEQARDAFEEADA
jgi:hypothetical protein